MAEKEYIERGALLAEYDRVHVGPPGGARKLIAEAPAADVAEVVHGYWMTTDAYPHWLVCSECRVKFLPNVEFIGRYDIPTKYCPNCGARMDGEREPES